MSCMYNSTALTSFLVPCKEFRILPQFYIQLLSRATLPCTLISNIKRNWVLAYFEPKQIHFKAKIEKVQTLQSTETLILDLFCHWKYEYAKFQKFSITALAAQMAWSVKFVFSYVAYNRPTVYKTGDTLQYMHSEWTFFFISI